MSLLPASTIRALGQKEYEKRKQAALEVEAHVRELRDAQQYEKINAIVKHLALELANSAQAHVRKGALHALSGTAIGLRQHAGQMLPQLLPPVLSALSDPDPRVRYTACEALYNIAKVARSSCVAHINEIFDGLFKLSADTDVQVQNGMQLLDRLMKDVVTESEAFDLAAFMPLLGERIYVSNPFSRQFLVGWISTLGSVPDLDLVAHLPVFLDGLFHMLADANREIRTQTFDALNQLLREIGEAEEVDYAPLFHVLVTHCSSRDKFTTLTSLSWLHPLISHAQALMLPFCAPVLNAVLSSLSHPEEELREAAARADTSLRALLHQSNAAQFEMGTVLHALAAHLSSAYVPTLLAALQWVHMLLLKNAASVLELAPQLWPPLFKCLGNPSEEVVRLALEALAKMVDGRDQHSAQHSAQPGGGASSLKLQDGAAPDATDHMAAFCDQLLALLRAERPLLERRGRLIVAALCETLGPRGIFETLARGLTSEADLDFASQMVQALNVLVLTSAEALALRSLLRKGVGTAEGAALFRTLYPAWCHNPASLLSMCLVAQAYEHAAELVMQFASLEITLPFLLQIDKLVQLVESPIFTHVRLHLLEPEQHPHLLRALGGILMLLPQSPAFHTLQARLAAVPELGIFRLQLEARKPSKSTASDAAASSLDWRGLLQTYKQVQQRHADRLLEQPRGAGGLDASSGARGLLSEHTAGRAREV